MIADCGLRIADWPLSLLHRVQRRAILDGAEGECVEKYQPYQPYQPHLPYLPYLPLSPVLSEI